MYVHAQTVKSVASLIILSVVLELIVVVTVVKQTLACVIDDM